MHLFLKDSTGIDNLIKDMNLFSSFMRSSLPSGNSYAGQGNYLNLRYVAPFHFVYCLIYYLLQGRSLSRIPGIDPKSQQSANGAQAVIATITALIGDALAHVPGENYKQDAGRSSKFCVALYSIIQCLIVIL